jgi:hypothetical protein
LTDDDDDLPSLRDILEGKRQRNPEVIELDRQNMRIHELFRGYSLHRDYNYRPTLPEHLRWQLEEMASGDQKAAPSTDECDIKERQKLYDQRRQARDRAVREHRISAQVDSLISESFPYESDFVQARKLMPERDRLAENLFKGASVTTLG